MGRRTLPRTPVLFGEIDLSRQSGMLHDAMRAYVEWIKKDCFRPALGRVTDYGRTKIRQIETLMTRHENQPLSMLDEATTCRICHPWLSYHLRLGKRLVTEEPFSLQVQF